MAKLLRMLGGVLGGVVGDPGADVAARAGQNADKDADDGALGNGGDQGFELLPGRNRAAGKVLGIFIKHRVLTLGNVLDGEHDLAEGEQTDHRGNELNAGLKLENAEAVTGRRGLNVQTDAADHQTQAAGEQTLHHVVAGQRTNDGQAEHADEEVLKAGELQRDLRKRRSDEQKCNSGDRTTDHGSHGGNTDGLEALALLGQSEAVRCRSRGRGCTGRVEQAGGNRTAVDRGGVYRSQQGNTGLAAHTKGNGDQQSDRHGCRQARHRTDEHTAERTSNQRNDHVRLAEHRRTLCHQIKHIALPPLLQQRHLKYLNEQNINENEIHNVDQHNLPDRADLFHQHERGDHNGRCDKIVREVENQAV